MIERRFRHTYQAYCIEPLLPLIHLHPQTITWSACLAGVAVLPLLFLGYHFLALAAMALSGFLDTLDGSIARYRQLASSTGAALDITCDRLVEFAIVLGLFCVNPASRALPCIVMLGSILLCVTTFLVVGIFTENKSSKGFHYSPGLMERAEAFLFFAVMILLPAQFLIISSLFSFFTLLTAAIRLRQFLTLNKTCI